LETVAIALATLLGADSTALAADTPAHVDSSYPNYQPPYPDGAQERGEQGVVMVDVYVRPNGRPKGARIAQSSGFYDLDTAAMQGVLNWRFVPATRDGEPVSDWTAVKIVYQLPVAATLQYPTAQPGTAPK
jgi:protein TonB